MPPALLICRSAYMNYPFRGSFTKAFVGDFRQIEDETIKSYKWSEKMRIVLLLLLTGSTLISGCATIVRGSKETFNVTSVPIGASVTTTNGFKCDATPCSFRIARKAKFGVVVTMSGHKTFTAQVSNRISGRGGAGVAGNIVAGGFIGIGVDAISGASLDLQPNPMKVILEPEGSNAESRLEPAAAATTLTTKS